MRGRGRMVLAGPYKAEPKWRAPDGTGKYQAWLFDQRAKVVRRSYPQWEPLAQIFEGGLLVRNRITGALAEHWGICINAVIPRKAEAALAELDDQ